MAFPTVSQRSREAGVATITVVVICAGLAVVAAALMNFAVDGSRQVEAEIAREVERQALRSALAETVADLVRLETVSDRRSYAYQYGKLDVNVAISGEAQKANVWTSDEAQLTAALRRLRWGPGQQLATPILAARSDETMLGTSMDVFLERLQVPAGQHACLRELLTVHTSPVDPLSAANTDGIAWSGAILRLRATPAKDNSDRVREAVVVLTGDPGSPAIWLEERELRASKLKECLQK